MSTVPAYRHKGEELDAIKHPYEKGIQCKKWAEEMRDAWYEAKLAAEAGDDPLCKGPDDISRGYQFTRGQKSKDLIGLEQMYSRWATMYFEQCSAWYAARESPRTIAPAQATGQDR